MKKIIFTALALLATMSISAQTIKVYEYDSEGNLNSTPAYTSSNKVKVVFEKGPNNPNAGKIIEGTTTINGTTYTKAVGGTEADYVDLGITVDGKKVLWATHNLGASKPEEYGAYIAWGENGTEEEGYSAGVKTTGYNYSTLKYCSGKTYKGPFTKYVATDDYGTVDNITTLESLDDAATVNWGSDWRTPTDAELIALYSNCTWTWYAEGNTDYNGVAGRKLTGPNGNSIFLPAAGFRNYGSLVNAGSGGYYWQSMLNKSYSLSACWLSFYSDNIYWTSDCRYYGRSVRPVRSE